MQPSDALLNRTLQYLSARPWREVTDLMDGWLAYGRQVADAARYNPTSAPTTWSTPHVEEQENVTGGGSEGVEGADIHDDHP